MVVSYPTLVLVTGLELVRGLVSVRGGLRHPIDRNAVSVGRE